MWSVHPQYLYRVNRTDLEDLRWVWNVLQDMERHGKEFRSRVFVETLTGKEKGMRSPLLTMTGNLAKAVKRLNSSLEKCKQNGRQGGILVRADLLVLAEVQTILQEDVIDISS